MRNNIIFKGEVADFLTPSYCIPKKKDWFIFLPIGIPTYFNPFVFYCFDKVHKRLGHIFAK
jgi:hypothetical protein